MTQATFDFTGEQLKRAGMALAQEHADAVMPGWSELAYQFLVNQFLPLHKRFMAEDVRSYAAQVDFTLPPHARAWGGVIAKAAKEYLIIKTSIRPVKNPKAHCANAALWERNDERLIEVNYPTTKDGWASEVSTLTIVNSSFRVLVSVPET